MAATAKNRFVARVYFIIGCTACGKGSVGRELARRVGGRILSVDSMKVYRRMDIGTAKPSTGVRAEISHYCIDLVEPSESFSVARYLECAESALAEIASAAAPALAVGGTSLYLKALSEGLFEGPSADAELREQLRARAGLEGLAELHAELSSVDPAAAAKIHPNDEKRIIRALEVHHLTGRPISELQQQWNAGKTRHDCTFIGLRRTKDDQSSRINLRAKRMVEAGLRDEVSALLAEPDGLSPQSAAAVGYAEMIQHLRGEIPLDDAIEAIKINTRRLAKKQRTWQRRFPNVQWFDLAAGDQPAAAADRILAEVDFLPA